MVMWNGGSSQSVAGVGAMNYGEDRTEPWLFQVLGPMHGMR